MFLILHLKGWEFFPARCLSPEVLFYFLVVFKVAFCVIRLHHFHCWFVMAMLINPNDDNDFHPSSFPMIYDVGCLWGNSVCHFVLLEIITFIFFSRNIDIVQFNIIQMIERGSNRKYNFCKICCVEGSHNYWHNKEN